MCLSIVDSRTIRLSAVLLLFVGFLGVATGASAQQLFQLRVESEGSDRGLQQAFATLDPARVSTGLLHDQVVNLVDLDRFDGTRPDEIATVDEWRQMLFELSRSAFGPDAAALPSLDEVDAFAESYLEQGVVPIAVLDVDYTRFRDDAFSRGMVRVEGERLIESAEPGPGPYETRRVFAVIPYRVKVHDRSVRFQLPASLYITPDGIRPADLRIEVDLDDGAGWRALRIDESVVATYGSAGAKTIRVRASQGGQARTASATLSVARGDVPTPDQTWLNQQATLPYADGFASYDAYAFFAPNHTELVRPVIFVEGFDPYYDDPTRRRTWEEIYELLSEESFAESLLANKHDIVILKLHNATDYVQRNAFALIHLLETIEASLPITRPRNVITVVGPSMGGLIGRYALAFREAVARGPVAGLETVPAHLVRGTTGRVRGYVSIDAPHQGANIPLGDQFFCEFFDSDSEVARACTDALNSIAARQMLVYQYEAVPAEDPLRTALRTELDALGYPTTTWNASLANGSGFGLTQLGDAVRMQPGDKIVEYRYRSFFIRLDGDVWAVPDEDDPVTRIFEGTKDVIGPHYRALDVFVEGTQPFDNAPGGKRGTQGEIAAGDPPYGQIFTSFPDHDWIPTVSALDLATPDLLYHVNDDPDDLVTPHGGGRLSTEHYDWIYYPEDNEGHVDPNPTNAEALLRAILPGQRVIILQRNSELPRPTSADGVAETSSRAGLPTEHALDGASPNPFRGTTEIRFALPEAGSVSLAIYDALGRRVAVLAEGPMEAGRHRVAWDAAGLPGGVYLVRLEADGYVQTRSMVRVR